MPFSLSLASLSQSQDTKCLLHAVCRFFRECSTAEHERGGARTRHNSGIGVRRNERVAREIIGHDVAYAITWTDLKKKMTDKYCPKEAKIKEKPRMFSEESDKIEKYVGDSARQGLWSIDTKGLCIKAENTMQDAIKMATELMDKKISTLAERQAENKRKLDNNKPTNTISLRDKMWLKAISARTGERKGDLELFHWQHGVLAAHQTMGHGTQEDFPELKNQTMETRAEGEVCFGKRGKLNPRYVGPSKVMEKVGSVAYKLELPQELSRVHHTFHVSNLKKCYTDEPLAVPFNGFHIENKLHFIEEPAEIMDQKVKRLKQSRIQIVKV
ncbi:hypothetical protein Tco_0619689 [Tanacetum coccineum]